ncbi:MAG TPA: arylsulfatase [Sumerlaeia bacterium]|nr:arylsulfatase [Sumerlaeia bacterium]
MPSNRLRRRDFLRIAGGAAAGVLIPTSCRTAKTSPPLPAKPPNIVFILADDMGYGDLACQNPESKIPTPNLDRLAREGMRFTDAHSPAAVCTPTRYAILTGRYCWRTHLKSGVLWAWDPPLIEPDRLTLPAMLKRHGYDTACIGKWHLGWDWPTTDGEKPDKQTGQNVDFHRPVLNGPTARGFDYYFGTAVPNFPPYCFIENDRTVGIPAEQKPKTMFGHPGPMLPGWDLADILPGLADKAVGYINAEAMKSPVVATGSPQRPFFLYFPLTAPHTPIAPAPRFRGKSQAGAYGDFVHQVDWTVGMVMAALERNGLTQNTLVMFGSDNGSPARDGANMSGPINSVRKYGHNPSGRLRGIKADVWDGGHRTPFIVRWPGRIEPGSVCDETICLVDLMATCAAIVGEKLAPDAAEDSYNVLPALLGEKRAAPIRETTVHHSGGGMFAVRQGPWKLILGRGSGGWTKGDRGEDLPPGQLYNMAENPSETENLYTMRPDMVERLTAILEKYKREGRSAPVSR